MSESTSPRVLIVDDEAPQMKALCNTLEPEGYQTMGFTSASQALAALNDHDFDLVLTDLMMPEMDGITLLRKAFEVDQNVVGIVMTGHGTVDTAVEALKAGALDYILKPFRLSAILPVLSRALTVRRLRMENIQLRQAMGVHEVSVAIALALDTGKVLQKLVDTVMQQSQARNVSVLLLSADKNELKVAAAGGEDGGSLRHKCVPFDHAVANWVEECREALSRNDEGASVPAAFVCPSPALAGFSVPMLVASRLIGVVNFDLNYSRRSMTLGQVKALNILAGAAASALEVSSLLEQLRNAEQRYRRLAENAPDIVFRYDLVPCRCFAYVNPVIKNVTGYTQEEFYADPDLGLRIVHQEDRSLMEEVLLGTSATGGTVTMRWVDKNGKVAWIEQHSVHVRDSNGRLMAVEGVARDITERKNLEEQLRHAQKLEAIGQLTGGVAHDFNNLLTVINGYTDLMLGEVSGGGALRERLDEVRKAGERAGALTRQLLAFGRKQLSQPRVLNLNKTVHDSSKMLARLLGEDIELVADLDLELVSVKADEGQIEQILMNLAVNSRDAMPQGGRLMIETRNAILDEPLGRQTGSVGTCQFAMLAVSDTGCGMDQATRSRIFEPFFTTKEAGRGTGLGLSIVRGIVDQNGGTIEIESQVGSGTTFRIYLPFAKEQEGTAEAPGVSEENPRGSETILVVEDDTAVRQLMSTILGGAGYHVVTARNGKEALEVCRDVGAKFALVLTDLVMPEMSGPALIEQLKCEKPLLKVLYTSGHPDDASVRHGPLEPTAPFIQKPFSPGNLLRMIRTLMD